MNEELAKVEINAYLKYYHSPDRRRKTWLVEWWACC